MQRMLLQSLKPLFYSHHFQWNLIMMFLNNKHPQKMGGKGNKKPVLH